MKLLVMTALAAAIRAEALEKRAAQMNVAVDIEGLKEAASVREPLQVRNLHRASFLPSGQSPSILVGHHAGRKRHAARAATSPTAPGRLCPQASAGALRPPAVP